VKLAIELSLDRELIIRDDELTPDERLLTSLEEKDKSK